MKCAKCPLFSSWNNESDKGEACGLFGDGWDNQLQYEDKDGTTVGCYVDRHYIMRCDKKYDEYLGQLADDYIELFEGPLKEERE